MEVDKDTFYQIIRDERVKNICSQIAACGPSPSGEDRKGALKRKLPAFCWHAWFDEGKRKNYAAHASGLVMMDVDHIDDPRAVYNKVAEAAVAMGLLAAHVTPSTKGLRLVFPVPQGMDIVQAQSYYAKALQLKNIDACTKDLARLSFCVPEEYFLFLDEEALFKAPSSHILGEHIECFPTSPRGGTDCTRQDAAAEECHAEQAQRAEASCTQSDGKQGETQGERSFDSAQDDNSAPYPTHYVLPFGGAERGAGASVPYNILVQSLQEQLGGVPAHGSRNNFIFSMAAYLRYVCNDDPEWIASILPTYGEAHDKWRRTIESACQRAQYKVMPAIVKRAIELAKQRSLPIEREGQGEGLPPAMPKKLPKLIAHLIKNVPEVCKPAVANAVFPALAAHLHNVKFKLIDGTDKEATFMCVTMAKQSSGKSAVNKPIEYITADIVERDELNRRREQEWKDATAQKGANKEKPKRPDDLCVQVLVSDMTNAAFVQRMKDACGKYLYTNLEELELLKQLQTNGTKDVGKIICLCFDNGKYGQERVGTQSVTARVDVRWNWNASSTIQKGMQFFRGRLVDGTLSRINFCTIIRDKTKPFVYGEYDDQYAEVLKPYITNLNLANGRVECKQALALARQMNEQCEETGDLSDDEAYEELSHRAVTIAYLKAMVLYIAHDMTWSKEIAEFAQWSLEYDMWCKMHFFAGQMREESAKEVVSSTPGRQNLLELLPDEFTLSNVCNMRRANGLDESNAKPLINKWVFRGYIQYDPDHGVYIKTPTYLNRNKA